MVINSSAVIILPNDGEFKVKKKQEPEEIKPVEGSGKSAAPELDITRDKITEKTPEQRNFDIGYMYNKNGGLRNSESDDQGAAGMNLKSIDVLV